MKHTGVFAQLEEHLLATARQWTRDHGVTEHVRIKVMHDVPCQEVRIDVTLADASPTAPSDAALRFALLEME